MSPNKCSLLENFTPRAFVTNKTVYYICLYGGGQGYTKPKFSIILSISSYLKIISTLLKHEIRIFKGVLHLWDLFLKTLCIFSKNKATLDKVSYGSDQKYSKELKNHSFTSVEAIVVKLQ